MLAHHVVPVPNLLAATLAGRRFHFKAKLPLCWY